MINACRWNLKAHSYGAGAGAPAAKVLGAVSAAVRALRVPGDRDHSFQNIVITDSR
jgi:hypothetical protein